MGEIEVFVLEYDGSKLYDPNVDNVLAELRALLTDPPLEAGEKLQVVIERQAMTREKFDALPEFDGF